MLWHVAPHQDVGQAAARRRVSPRRQHDPALPGETTAQLEGVRMRWRRSFL